MPVVHKCFVPGRWRRVRSWSLKVDGDLSGYHRIVAEVWRGERLVWAPHLPETAGRSLLWSLEMSEDQDLIGYHRIVAEV